MRYTEPENAFASAERAARRTGFWCMTSAAKRDASVQGISRARIDAMNIQSASRLLNVFIGSNAAFRATIFISRTDGILDDSDFTWRLRHSSLSSSFINRSTAWRLYAERDRPRTFRALSKRLRNPTGAWNSILSKGGSAEGFVVFLATACSVVAMLDIQGFSVAMNLTSLSFRSIGVVSTYVNRLTYGKNPKKFRSCY